MFFSRALCDLDHLAELCYKMLYRLLHDSNSAPHVASRLLTGTRLDDEKCPREMVAVALHLNGILAMSGGA